MRRFLLGLCFSLCTLGALLLVVNRAQVWRNAARAFRPVVAPLGTRLSARLTSQQSRAAIARRYGQLPMAFEPNVGQTNPQAKFLARGSGYETFLTPSAAVIVLQSRSNRRRPSARVATGLERPSAGSIKTSVLSMELLGARPARLSAVDELPGKSNYLIGDNPAKWHTNIANYRKVTEKGVYPGVDLVYYGTQHQLEYDFAVAPGANPHVIRLGIRGAKSLRIGRDGNLLARVSGGTVKFLKPVAYQPAGLNRQPIDAGYILKGKNEVALRVGEYDRSQPLVIDPVLAYSTYLGGSGIDVANAITVAGDDTAFIAGATFSGDFPTAHPLQPNAGGPVDFPKDAFVAKISADGSTLLYSTYLGGKEDDVANGIAVDFLGNAYVTGTTHSSDFPVTALAQNVECGGDGSCGATWNTQGRIVSNGFVSKLNSAGSALVYSTYIGYYEDVSSQAIAVDNNQIAYITGQVTNDFPVTLTTPPPSCPPLFPTTNGFQTAIAGSTPATSDGCPYTAGGATTNAFVMALSATGTSVLYSSYLGGTTEDVGYGIAASTFGHVYVAGLTYSANFPTLNGVDLTYGGAGDAFFAEINTQGSGTGSLLYSTYLGGDGLDQANAIAVDSLGQAYVAGVTSSRPITLTFPQLNAYSGDGDAFVAKLNPFVTGASSLVYFRYLGGSLADSANGIAVDSSGDAYVTGSTVSSDFPVVTGAFQPTYGGGNADAFVSKIDPTGATLLYSSYLGGTNTDVGNAIAVDQNGAAYVTGQTCSLDFPLAHPLQNASGGNCDAFVSKVTTQGGIVFNPAGLVFPAQSLGTTSQPQTVTLTNNDTSTVTISSITIGGTDPGDFSETNTCGSTVTAGGTCTITVTFSPAAAGIRTAEIDFTDTASNSPQVVTLSGTSSTLVLTASNLSFGNVVIGTTSPAQSIVVTNQGTTAVTFASITASGPFAEADDCTKVPLQPGTNCSISVTFTPMTAGAAIGALELSDNAPGSPQEVLLTGTGVQQQSGASLQVAPASLSFGNQVVATTSPAQTITATNQGTVAVTISSVVASGPFTEADDCTKAALQPGANCTINVTFAPISAGSSIGTVTVTDNAPGSPQIVTLTGTGVQPTSSAILSLSATTLAFGNEVVGSTSSPMAVTASNQGTVAITITSVVASGAFAETDNCTKAPLQPGNNCSISVTFTPLGTGSNVGSVTVTDDAQGSPQLILLTGTGVQQSTAATLQVSPTSLSFANQTVGTTSASQTVTASNTGTVAVTFSAIAASGAFAETDDCTKAPLQPGTNCAINVTFSPISTGTANGALTLTDNAGGSPQIVSLTGSGVSTSTGGGGGGGGTTPDFSISAQPTSATVNAGTPAQFTLTVGAVAGFSQPVNISCSGLPSSAFCHASPNPATPGQNVTLTITTTSRSMLAPGPSKPGTPIAPPGAMILFAGMALALLLISTVGSRRPEFSARRALAAFALVITMALFSAACGGGAKTGQTLGTPAGTYQVTVTGTSGTVSHSTTLGLQVN